ncbi:MAG: DUF4055 domain-containing protein [Bacteroidia bacterium]|nr:DUF4055 domain-containing protein [Bacteroidia bacterium]
MTTIIEKVSVRHPQYKAFIYVWRLVRDFVGGSASVKRNNVLYLPMPGAMVDSKSEPGDAVVNETRPPKEIGGFEPSSRNEGISIINDSVPWYYPTNRNYESYLRRARVPDITAFALRGLLGIATSKPPSIDLPSELKYLIDDSTNDGFSIYELFAFMVGEIMQSGRIGVMLDTTIDNKFKIMLYSAEAAINWNTESENGENTLKYVVLLEDELDLESDNIYAHEVKSKYLVLRMYNPDPEDDTENNPLVPGFIVDVYREDQKEDYPLEINQPIIFNQVIDEIPFIFAGSIDNTADCDESPLQGVADIALQIYMKTADLNNAEFMTCNPTLYVTGVDKPPSATGSNIVIALPNPEATMAYTETDTSGLSHVLEHIISLQEEAAAFGATLLGARKKGAESAEAVKIHRSVGGATLQSAVVSASNAIEKILKMAARWSGKNDSEVSFVASTEFANSSLSHTDIAALLSSYLSGALSLEALVEQHRKAGILPDGDTVDDEMERLEKQMVNIEDEDLSTAE